jgi:hypothetical protein
MNKKAAIAIELAKLLLLHTALSFSGNPAGSDDSFTATAALPRPSFPVPRWQEL